MSLKVDHNIEFTTVDGDPLAVPVGKVALFAKDGTKKIFIKDELGVETDISSGGDLLAANNLSDVLDPVAALTNLSGEPAFVKNTAFNKNFGTALGDVAEGNDTRFTTALDRTNHTGTQLSSTISDKGLANGLATLDGAGLVPDTQIPTLSLGAVSSVADIPARDALTPVQGDIAIVADNGIPNHLAETFIWTGTAWITLISSGAVLSVNSKVGVVNLVSTDIPDFQTTVSSNTDVSANNAHRISTGADHSWLNQSLTTTDPVTFGSVTSTGDLTVGTNNLFVNTATGKVGINTTTPSNTLQIQQSSGDNFVRMSTEFVDAGNDGLSILETFAWNGSATTSQVIGELVSFSKNYSGLELFLGQSVANTVQLKGILKSSGGKMLIGTNSSAPLMLGANNILGITIEVNGNPTINTTLNPSTVLNVGNNLNVASGKLFVNAATGNIGIGTVTPSNTLDILGAIAGISIKITNPLTATNLIMSNDVTDLLIIKAWGSTAPTPSTFTSVGAIAGNVSLETRGNADLMFNTITANSILFATNKVLRMTISPTGAITTPATATHGFFGATAVGKALALTAIDATATDGTVVTNDTITNNIRTRLNELEARLQSYGLLN